MNRVWCIFENHYTNPLTGRTGRWRVVETYPIKVPSRVGAVLLAATADGKLKLGVITAKQPKHGSIISPRGAMLQAIMEMTAPTD